MLKRVIKGSSLQGLLKIRCGQGACCQFLWLGEKGDKRKEWLPDLRESEIAGEKQAGPALWKGQPSVSNMVNLGYHSRQDPA